MCVTPEIGFPERRRPHETSFAPRPLREVVAPSDGRRRRRSGRAATPFPLTEEIFLASMDLGGRYGIFLIDTLGGRELIYEDNAITWTQGPTNVLDLIQQRYRWTRGILQAIRKRKGILLRPFPDFPLWLSAVEMAFEGVLWPVLNVYAHLFFAMVALLFGMGELLLYWWILLTLLDMVVALITVSMEEESLSLVPLAVIYRFFFILFLDVTKTFAAVEEALNLGMEWGKLRRIELGKSVGGAQ